MSNQPLPRYLFRVLVSILRYALYGALLAGAFAFILTFVTSLIGAGPEFSLTSTLDIAGSYATFGALFGGLLGLLRGLLTQSQL